MKRRKTEGGDDDSLTHSPRHPRRPAFRRMSSRASPGQASSPGICRRSWRTARRAASSRSTPRTTWAPAARRIACCTAIRSDYPLSIHGVGLSIGGAAAARSRASHAAASALIDRYQPALFSEHLAWSTHDGVFLNDLLPLPYTEATLAHVCDHVDEVQDASAADAARKSLDLCRLRQQHDERDRIPRARSRGAPAAACCSTSTTSMSPRSTTASTPPPISTASRSSRSAKSTSPACRATDDARRPAADRQP